MQGAVAQGQFNQNAANTAAAQQNAGLSGLFSLGGSALQGAGQAGSFGALFG